jgi:hypothetical protein
MTRIHKFNFQEDNEEFSFGWMSDSKNWLLDLRCAEKPEKRKCDDTVQEMVGLFEIPKIAKGRDNKSHRNSDRAWLEFGVGVVLLHMVQQVLLPEEAPAADTATTNFYTWKEALIVNFTEVFGELATSQESSIHRWFVWQGSHPAGVRAGLVRTAERCLSFPG